MSAIPDRSGWDDATKSYVAALEAANSRLRDTLVEVVTVAGREANVHLPKRVDAMAEDELAIFEVLSRPHSALTYLGQRAAGDLAQDAPTVGITFNINDYFRFNTTDAGTAFLLEHAANTRAGVRSMIRDIPEDAYLPHRDDDGCWRMQAWDFFNVFGPKCYHGGPNLIKDNRIIVEGWL